MKASIKFREDQKPLFRAKIPLNILKLPFQSGIAAGDTNDLTLHLSSFFKSGPVMKFAYRPNDALNPFSLYLKTGTGSFGSPVSSSMLMTAEFSLVSKGNPKFMIHFKPQFGDLSIKKSQSSDSVFEKAVANKFDVFGKSKTMTLDCNGSGAVTTDDDGSVEAVKSPFVKKVSLSTHQQTVKSLLSAFSGVEVMAKTKVPVTSRAVMNLRWGVRVPAEVGAGINLRKFPFLVMNKIGFKHVYDEDESKQKNVITKEAKNDDVAVVCMKVKRQVEWLQLENLELKKAVDNLRQEIGFGGKLTVNNGNSYLDGGKTEIKKDLSEEIKKSLMGGSTGSSTATTNTTTKV